MKKTGRTLLEFLDAGYVSLTYITMTTGLESKFWRSLKEEDLKVFHTNGTTITYKTKDVIDFIKSDKFMPLYLEYIHLKDETKL